MTDPELATARARAAAARADLIATLRMLQARLSPSSLAGDAIDTIKRKGEAVASDAAAKARARPATVSAVAAGLGALIGARLFWRRTHDKGDER